MKRYPAYKQEHRLPGIQEVPKHWGVVRNSLIFKEVSETGYGHLELLSILSDKGIVKQSETGRKERAPEDRSSYKRIQQGDIGYNLMNAFMGSIGASNYEGIISPAYAVCRPKIKIEPNYFHYLFRTDLYLTEFDRNAYGIMYERNRLYFDNFKRIYVPFPPLDEQKAIAHFIDRKLEQIEHFIRNKQRLIELLNEQKTAIINRAVTKGINPHVPMKYSGIEWLGEIPAHWEVTKIKYVSSIISKGTTPSTVGDEIIEQGSIRFLKAENILDGTISLNPEFFISIETNERLKRSKLKLNDVLFVIAGATLGKVALVRETHLPANTNQAVAFIRHNQQVIPEFLIYWFQSSLIKELIWLSAVQSAQPNLSMEDLGNFSIPLPAKPVQQQLLDYLDSKCSQLNQAIAKAEREIELIQEYRTTIISDAVTGKIDLRPNAAFETTLTA